MAGAKLLPLVAVYQQQLDCYNKMLALAQEQSRCLESNNLPVFQEIMERRERLQEEVSELALQAQRLCSEISSSVTISEFNLSNLRKKLLEADVEPLAHVLEQLTAAITAIQKQDEANTQQITDAINSNKHEAHQLNRARDAVRAYNPIVPTVARFVDKRK